MPFSLVQACTVDVNPVLVIIDAVRLIWDRTLASPSRDASRWQELMVAAQGGDGRAYATLLKEASTFVRLIARRYHGDAGAVEDVVQETLLTVHRVRHTYEPGRPVEPWIAAIAKARAIDALRARKRRGAVEGELTDAVVASASDRATRHDDVLAANDEVATAMSALPASQRAALQMLKIEEMSLTEAARASGQSASALKSLLHRAMRALRASLRSGGDA